MPRNRRCQRGENDPLNHSPATLGADPAGSASLLEESVASEKGAEYEASSVINSQVSRETRCQRAIPGV